MKRPEEQTLTGIPEELKQKNGASTRRKQSCIKDLLEVIKAADEDEQDCEDPEAPLRDEDDGN